MDVAKKLDAMFTQLLDAGAEAAHVHWDEYTIARRSDATFLSDQDGGPEGVEAIDYSGLVR